MWRAILLSGVVAMPAQAAGETQFVTGKMLFEMCFGGPTDLRTCYGYIEGVADAMATSPVDGHRACIPLPVTNVQVKEIVVQYLERNGADRQFGAAGLVAKALQQSFPCQ
jgi:hypothetical protein